MMEVARWLVSQFHQQNISAPEYQDVLSRRISEEDEEEEEDFVGGQEEVSEGLVMPKVAG
jgi:hypothetical protein